jgi:large subunit ribosomal protein L41
MHATIALLGRKAVRKGFTKLTTKLAKKGYYKGKNSISPGWHEKGKGTKGEFVLLDFKRPNYAVPEFMDSFALKPYVAKNVLKK